MGAAILPCELVVGTPFPAISCSILFALNTVLSLAGLFHTQAGFASRDQPPFIFFPSFMSAFYLHQRDPPLPLSPAFLTFTLSIFTCCLTSLSLLSWTTSFGLCSSALLPSTHTLDVSPELLWCGNPWHRGGNATFQLCPREFAPCLLRCDLPAGPLVGE